AAVAEVELASRSLARSTRSAAELGFLGPSPMIDAPELFTAFADRHPEFHISFRQLPFPRESTASWIAEVDIGLCFEPTPHPDVDTHTLRGEPRVVLAAKHHPL